MSRKYNFRGKPAMNRQDYSLIVVGTDQGKTASEAELLALLASGHTGCTISISASTAVDAMRRCGLLDQPEFNASKEA